MLRYSACDAQFSLAFMPLEPTSEGRCPQPAEAVTHWNYGPASRKSDVPPNDSPARRLKQLVRDEAVRGTVRTKSTAQLELMLR